VVQHLVGEPNVLSVSVKVDETLGGTVLVLEEETWNVRRLSISKVRSLGTAPEVARVGLLRLFHQSLLHLPLVLFEERTLRNVKDLAQQLVGGVGRGRGRENDAV